MLVTWNDLHRLFDLLATVNALAYTYTFLFIRHTDSQWRF